MSLQCQEKGKKSTLKNKNNFQKCQKNTKSTEILYEKKSFISQTFLFTNRSKPKKGYMIFVKKHLRKKS